jgi:diacylglycerol kinase family enzyme
MNKATEPIGDPLASSMTGPVMVLINAASGTGCTQEWADQLADKFGAHGLTAHVTLTDSGERMRELASAAVAQGAGCVVAGGGDGTIGTVAACLMGSQTALGVLPMGTLNHFAKDLQIPLLLDDAVRLIAADVRIAIDVAEVNGRTFINNSSLGLYPDIVHRREQMQRRYGRSKWVAFFWALVAVLRRYPFLQVSVTLNGVVHRRSTPFVFIGNNDYVMEGVRMGQRSRLDAATLCCYMTNRTGRFGLLMLALRALFGRLRQTRDVDVVLASEVLIESRHRLLRVATDGEVNPMPTPLAYRIRPRSLHVIVPKPQDGDA